MGETRGAARIEVTARCFSQGNLLDKSSQQQDLSPGVPRPPAHPSGAPAGGSAALPPAAPAGRGWARSHCGEFTRCRGNPRRQSRRSDRAVTRRPRGLSREPGCEDGARAERVEVKGAAGSRGAQGHRAFGEGPGTAQGGMLPVRESGTPHPCVCRHREWHGHSFPGMGTATALFPAQPHWSGNTGMENLVMSSREENSCVYFLK